MNLYFDELVGDRYIRQVPNAGHGLDGGRDGALTTLAVFFRHVASNTDLPRISWDFSNEKQLLKLAIKSSPAPANVRLWTAKSDDLDFRDDRWSSKTLTGKGESRLGTLEVPKSGHVALYGEVEFDFDGLPWSLTTLVYRK
jgi:PhoPQ-activated pathogenicity-related protein